MSDLIFILSARSILLASVVPCKALNSLNSSFSIWRNRRIESILETGISLENSVLRRWGHLKHCLLLQAGFGCKLVLLPCDVKRSCVVFFLPFRKGSYNVSHL